MIILKQCPICESEEWHSLDYLRDQYYWYVRDYREEGEPIGFKVCKSCGYTSYDQLGEERQRASYTRQRAIIQANSLITCARKNEYHKAFLDDPFWDFIKPEMKILDVGCAQGDFLAMLNFYYNIPIENLYGVEYAEHMLSWGMYENKLNLSKEIDKSIKYDMISYYHVLEHVEDIDTEIKMIKEILADDGYLYLSVPLFFDELEEKSGVVCASFEEYYHLNHIQCFSKKSFHNFLRKHGFKIIKEDNILYAYTVMCQRTQPDNTIEKENYLEIVNILEKQKRAIELMVQKKHPEALQEYPKYPDAYLFHSLNQENMKDFQKQIDILNTGLALMPDNTKLLLQLGKVYLQWDENTADKQFYSNNVKKAESIFKQLLEIKPGNEESLYFLAIIEGKYKQNYVVANDYFRKFFKLNPLKFAETIPLMAKFWKDHYAEENKNIC